MKASNEELEQLWSMQQLIIAQRRLVDEAKALSSGDLLRPLEASIQEANEGLRTGQLEYEALLEKKRKLESDLDLVEKRITSDEAKLLNSSSPSDIAGFQHELEGLRARKNLLEDSEIELLEEIDASNALLAKGREEKQVLESSLEDAKSDLSSKLAAMKQENTQLNEQIKGLRDQVRSELVELFDKKLSRGNAVGRLVRSSCSACNMNLNSTAMADLASVPSDELATCPECSAMVIRA